MTQPVNPSTGSNPNYTPPDYTPASTATPTPSGTVDIWGLPDGLGNTTIWYDTGAYGNEPSTSAQARAKQGDRGVSVEPTHKPGDTFQINMTADDLMKQVAAMSMNDPAGYQNIQKLLAAGNYYDGATRVYGTWNQTEAALAKAVQDYIKVTHNSQGEGAGVPINFQQYLQRVAMANSANGNPGNGAGGAGSGAPAPTVVSLADPDTLTRYAQMAAQNALGRSLKPEELQKFITQFHDQQLQDATTTVDDKADAKGAGQSGVVGMVNKDDARSSAVGFVEQNHQDEFAQHQIQGYTDAFLNMFLSGANSAPNVSVDPSAIGY